jgi:hypothetical protein
MNMKEMQRLVALRQEFGTTKLKAGEGYQTLSGELVALGNPPPQKPGLGWGGLMLGINTDGEDWKDTQEHTPGMLRASVIAGEQLGRAFDVTLDGCATNGQLGDFIICRVKLTVERVMFEDEEVAEG